MADLLTERLFGSLCEFSDTATGATALLTALATGPAAVGRSFATGSATAATVLTIGETILLSGAAASAWPAGLEAWLLAVAAIELGCTATLLADSGAADGLSVDAEGATLLAAAETDPELAGAAFAALDGSVLFAA